MRPTQVVVILSFLCVVGIIAVSFYTPRVKALHATLGGEALLLEVVDTEALRIRGLSGHKPLASNEGMLFVFPEDGRYGFWMKDMLFPIDILWLDSGYRIIDTKEHAVPESYPEVFTPHTSARFVLELPAGFFSNHHLKNGNILKMPL